MSDFGAEDEALYSSSKDDKPKRSENIGSAASPLAFCYPSVCYVKLEKKTTEICGSSTASENENCGLLAHMPRRLKSS